MGTDQKASILYVDDQRSHQLLFQKAFPEYSIVTVSSGLEGLDLLSAQNFFLIVADHHMPQMSGIDFLEEAARRSPQTARAILSAYHDPKLVAEALHRAKIAKYLQKPWKREQIRPIIESAWQASLSQASLIQTYRPTREDGVVWQEPPLPWDQLCHFLDRLENKVDKRGAKRICLNFVEPALRRFVAPIHRPVPESFRLAEQAALQGDIESLEKNLRKFLQDTQMEQQAVAQVTKDLPIKH